MSDCPMSKRHIFSAVAGSGEHYCFADVDDVDYIDWAFTADHTLIMHDTVSETRWWAGFANACIVSLCRYKYPGRDRTIVIGLADDGYVWFIGKEEGFVEKIPEAGLHADDSEGFGAMSRIRQIGHHLYAVGDGGQVYQRSIAGAWRHVDDGLLLPVRTDERLSLVDIDGDGDDRLFVVGDKGAVRWWDGVAWHAIEVPSTTYLKAVLVESAERVWICGWAGTLLLGNERDGFDELETGTDDSFLSMTMHDGTLYLGTGQGVSVYDGRRVTPIETGLVPALANGHIVDAVDGVLWSFGYSDIARFDGAAWTRFPVEPPAGVRPVREDAPPKPRPARAEPPTKAELFADEIADRVNCFGIGAWLDKLSALAGVPIQAPEDPKERKTIALEPLGLEVTLRRHDDPAHVRADQVVLDIATFDVAEAVLPFGLDAATLTLETAKAMLSHDTAGGRSVDIKNGNLDVTYFLEDARFVVLGFAPSLVGLTKCTVRRLGGEVDYRDIDRLFGRARLGVQGHGEEEGE